MKTSAFMLASLALVGCTQQRQPSVSEIFRLRGECAKLGDQLPVNEAGDEIVHVASNYSPEDNRCYVEVNHLEVSGPHPGSFTDILFDGQTKAELASYWEQKLPPYHTEDGHFPGCEKHDACTEANAKSYIEQKMKRSDQ